MRRGTENERRRELDRIGGGKGWEL